MAKKRTSLDALFTTAADEDQTFASEKESATTSAVIEKSKIRSPVKQSSTLKSIVTTPSKSEIVKQTVYLPAAVHEQLRQLAFEERKKMHDYLVEGLDRVFKNRGLKPFAELSEVQNNE